MPGTTSAERLSLPPGYCGVPERKKRGCCPERFPLVGVPNRRAPASTPAIVNPSSAGEPEAAQLIPERIQSSNTVRVNRLLPMRRLARGRSQTKLATK